MEYPNSYLRGISSPDQFDFDNNLPTLRLFPFQSNREKPDGWIEESISWFDDENAIEVTLNQVKHDGEVQFKLGIVVMKYEGLKRIKARLKHIFNYERASLPDNKYHGNLLVKGEIEKHLKTMISAALSFECEKHIPQSQ